jgi:hypothetical protein
MVQPDARQLNPFLRDVAISFVPQLSDDQLARIARALTTSYRDALVSRMTDFTALIRGIAVQAETAHEADRITWAEISHEVRGVLRTPTDAGTELTSIDVRLPAQSPFDMT